MTEKMTYGRALETAITVCNTEGFEEVAECLEKLKAQIAKRNGGSHKPTKTQRENEGLKEDIFAYVSENGAKRATEIGVYFGITGQKASALLKQLVDAGKLERYTEKRVTFFRVAEGY